MYMHTSFLDRTLEVLDSVSLMSAEASSGRVVSEHSPTPPCPSIGPEQKIGRGLAGSKYVKLNVGGSLHYTTVQTLSKEDSMLRSICDGGTEVTIDPEGECVHLCVQLIETYFKIGVS